jgi:hypothetical protein
MIFVGRRHRVRIHAMFSPGFRFSTFDIIVLALGMTGLIAADAFEWWLRLAVGIPVAAFFLFCNVFRISRALELIWAAVFIGLAAATIISDVPGWTATTIVSAGVAAIVIAIEMRRPSYHGIGWQRINPELPSWWNAHMAVDPMSKQVVN